MCRTTCIHTLCTQVHTHDFCQRVFLQATLGMATNSQCTPPALPQPGIGQCDQFGDVCRMWECPDVFDLSSGTWALKWSDQVTLCHLCSNYLPSPCNGMQCIQRHSLCIAPHLSACPNIVSYSSLLVVLLWYRR